MKVKVQVHNVFCREVFLHDEEKFTFKSESSFDTQKEKRKKQMTLILPIKTLAQIPQAKTKGKGIKLEFNAVVIR